MIRIAYYCHSKHFKVGRPAICGPRTYTNTPRLWQARIKITVPPKRLEIAAPDVLLAAAGEDGVYEIDPTPGGLVYEQSPFVTMVVSLGVAPYSIASELVADQLHAALGENPGWTDFEWEVWTPQGKAPKVRLDRADRVAASKRKGRRY